MKIEFTEAFIANQLICPPDRKKVEWVHNPISSGSAETRGLYVEVSRGTPGQGVYRFRYKCPATKTTKHIRIGSTSEVTLLAAFEQARIYRQRLNAGLEPVVLEETKPTMPTFREFFEGTYIPLVRNKKRSWKRDQDILRLRLADIADTPLDQITRLQLMKLHNQLKESGLAAATSNHGLKVARQVLGLAVSLDVIPKNVASGIRLFREEDLRDKFLSPEEIGRLTKVLRTDKNRPVCRILLMAVFTGARIGEILTCRHEDLDLEAKIWRIPAATTKTRRSRVVPLNESCLEVLKEVEKKDESGFVFKNPRTGTRYTTISKVWERLRTEAGLPTARIHDLRHAFAARLSANQENAFTIARLLGHSSVTMSEKYIAYGQATLLDASNRAADRINEGVREDVEIS